MCFTTRPVESFEVLNDLVVDRGPSPFVSLLELFGDEHHMTTVQADGLTVSTPTGSTAYSLSAGGSLVHPEIPALLITPICPHTLSFRPMLLPDTMELRICVPYNSRSTAWASFDGRGRVELKQGDHIKVTASKYPFPTVCADKQSTDWFDAISRTLKWNERERQKSFVVVEEGPAPPSRKSTVESVSAKGVEGEDEKEDPLGRNEQEEGEEDEVEEEEEEDDEEDKFDIDDLSGEASPQDTARSSPHQEPGSLDRHGQQQQQPHHHHRRVNLVYKTSDSGVVSPDRFAGEQPHPRSVHPRHLISEATAKIRNSPTSPNPHPHPHPRSYHPKIQSLTPISPKSTTTTGPSEGSSQSQSQSQAQSNPRPAANSPRVGRRYSRSAPAQPPSTGKVRRRRESFDGVTATSHAFAAWGLDETDSNASDSDP